MSIFNNRLSTSIDAYYRQVDNQLSNIDLPDHSGFNKVRSTEVSLVNYGLEVSLRENHCRYRANGICWLDLTAH